MGDTIFIIIWTIKKSKKSCALINFLKHALESYEIRNFMFLFFEMSLQL